MATENPPPTEDGESSAQTILLVDDVRLIRQALSRELQRKGYGVRLAESGEAALSQFQRGGIDVVLTDLAMPGMKGDELVEKLGELAPNTPCIVLTGRATRDDVVKLTALPNVVAILCKPWQPARLLEAIEAATAPPETHEQNQSDAA